MSNVLFLSSYSYSFYTVPQQIKGIEEILTPDICQIDYEFMDTKRFATKQDLQKYEEYLSYRLSRLPSYDAIIVGDDAALTFLMKYREELFPDVPIVFLGVNNIETAEDAAHRTNVTGIIEKADYAGNVDLICRLMPGVSNIVAVCDDTQTGIGDQAQFEACAEQYPNLSFRIINPSRLSQKEVAQQISEVGSNSAILYLTFFEDADGNRYTMDSAADMITQNAKVPVFRLSSGGIGRGVIGGLMISYEGLGKAAGNMVLSILHGKSADDIPLEMKCPTFGYFDHNAMVKFSLQEHMLPQGSVVLNKNYSFYDNHRVFCNILFLVMTFIIAIILLLLLTTQKQRSLIAQQKQTEEKLLESQNMLQEAISNSSIQYFTYFPKKHKVEIYILNERYDKFSTQWLDFPDSFLQRVQASEKDRAIYKDMVRKIDEGADTAECTIQMLYQNVYQWERVTMTAMRDENGHTVKVQGYSMDVTSQKNEMEQYSRELDNLSNMSERGLIAKGHINYSSGQILEYAAMHEAAGTVAAGQSYEEAYQFWINNSSELDGERPLAEALKAEDILRRYLLGDKRITIRYRRFPDKKAPIWLSTTINLYTSPDTRDVEGFTYTYDITEKILEEHIIMKLPDFGYENLGFIYAKQGIMLAYLLDRDRENSVVMKSGNYDAILKSTVNSKSMRIQQNMLWDALNLQHIVDKLEKQESYLYSFTVRADEPAETRQKQFLFSYADQKREIIFYCLSDVTQQYEAEKQQIAELEEAKNEADRASEAKSTFLSGMSHDLRTPLNGIIGFTELALREENPEKKQEYLKKIHYSGALLLDLVNDTLELSRIESGKMQLELEPVQTGEIWRSVVTALGPSAELKKITLDVGAENYQDELLWIDRLKTQKIFLNLLSNAIKYTPDGGKIRMEVMELKPPVNGCNRRIVVQDNGIGMSEKFQKKMFEPFVQEHRNMSDSSSGTGLGLTLVKRIVDLMGGTISVKSVINEGTTFYVDLPAREVDGKMLRTPKKVEDTISLKGRRVLICEDNHLNMEIVTVLLKEKGLEVVTAQNGQEGVALFQNSEEGYFDAVLMDIRMPVMDGYEATRTIRSMERADAVRIPIIAMTADAFAEDIRKCFAVGMDAHISKPIDPRRIFETLQDKIRDKEMQT